MSSNPNSGASNVGDKAANTIKEGVTKIHGIGEAIRGNINSFADSITNTDGTKSRNATQRGMEEIQTGKYQGTGAGVTPADTSAERVNRDVQGEPQAHGVGSETGSGSEAAPLGGESRFADGRFVK